VQGAKLRRDTSARVLYTVVCATLLNFPLFVKGVESGAVTDKFLLCPGIRRATEGGRWEGSLQEIRMCHIGMGSQWRSGWFREAPGRGLPQHGHQGEVSLSQTTTRRQTAKLVMLLIPQQNICYLRGDAPPPQEGRASESPPLLRLECRRVSLPSLTWSTQLQAHILFLIFIFYNYIKYVFCLFCLFFSFPYADAIPSARGIRDVAAALGRQVAAPSSRDGPCQ